ncbi:MAG: hypothetical protein MI784_00040 [Cytophagales bacterium]|nr:hypothetical protein [Cytophagales bacterium]
MKRIGIKKLTLSWLDNLKKDALYFDQILFDPEYFTKTRELVHGVIDAAARSKNKRTRDVWDSVFGRKEKDLEFLIENKVIIPTDFIQLIASTWEQGEQPNQFVIKNLTGFKELNQSQFNQFCQLLVAEFDDKFTQNSRNELVLKAEKPVVISNPEKEIPALIEQIDLEAGRRLKLLSIYHNVLESKNVYIPIMSENEAIGPSEFLKHTDVAKLLVSQMPQPSPDTSWEKILAFRQDSENQQTLRALRLWTRKVAGSDLNIGEIEEELEYLINRYQKLFELHKLKYTQSAFEIYVLATLETLENIARLKWSKAAKNLFALKKKEIDFAIETEKLECREIAYIVNAHDHFK